MSGRMGKGWLAMAIAAGAGLSAAFAAAVFPPLRAGMSIEAPAAASSETADLFAAAMVAPRSPDIDELAHQAGFVTSAPNDAWRGVILKEPKQDCAGRGNYLLRDDDEARPLAIAAPHRGSDRHSGTIAAGLFLATGAAAASWNSLPRRPIEACKVALDLARERDHPFTQFATSFAGRYPQGRYVQIHGFDQERRSDRARGADIVLSGGTHDPDARLLDLADCLSSTFAPHTVLVFPHETAELGALSNAQGKALRAAGFTGFVHVELSAPLRAAMVSDPALVERFGACLTGRAP